MSHAPDRKQSRLYRWLGGTECHLQPIFYPVTDEQYAIEIASRWWVPAEELEQLNDNIVGRIDVIGEYRKPV